MISISFEVQGIESVISMLEDLVETRIKYGMSVAVQQLAAIGVALGRPMIPIGPLGTDPTSGQTRANLRATMEGSAKARITVRGKQRHILRFLEGGTVSHGRGGGPLRAHHIMERLARQLEGIAKETFEVELEAAIEKATFTTVPRLRLVS